MMAASIRCDRDAAPLIAIALPFTVCICVANLQLQLQLGGIISRSSNSNSRWLHRCRRCCQGHRRGDEAICGPQPSQCNKLSKVMMRKVAKWRNTTTSNTIPNPEIRFSGFVPLYAAARAGQLLLRLRLQPCHIRVTAARRTPTIRQVCLWPIKIKFHQFYKILCNILHTLMTV